MFSRQPDLLRDATAEGSPTFFRCTLTDSTIRLEMLQALGGGLPGVYHVTSEPRSVRPQLRFAWMERFAQHRWERDFG